MGRNYYEYEVREIASNKVVKSVYISGITEDRGWVLGEWYENEDGTIKTEIKSKDGLFIAKFIERHYDTSGGELF